MGIGPVFAVPKLLEQTGKKVDDIDLWELNEAFAVQVIYCRDRLGIPDDRLNVNGGAIAVGHPYGMSRRAPGRPRADRRQAPRREARRGDDVHRRRHGRGGAVRGDLIMARYANILETVGNTPVVRIGKLAPPGAELYVKIEAFNPLGSVKDRLALGVIEDAERTGKLKPGQTVIEATSGNTGIGLAMVCAQKGYPLVVTMAESFSVERRKLMRFLGAKVVLTPAAESGIGMVEESRRARGDARLVPDPAVRERSQRRHALAHHGARDPARLRRASGSTTGSPASAPAAR